MNHCESGLTKLDFMKSTCINDPHCSGFSWPVGDHIPSTTTDVVCRKNNLEKNEDVNGWVYGNHQYLKCDSMNFVFSDRNLCFLI